MQSALGALVTDGIFTPIDVKREQLENAHLLNGPGSEQHPMLIDFESSEDVTMGYVFLRFVALLA